MALPRQHRLSLTSDVRSVFSSSTISAKEGRVFMRAKKRETGKSRFVIVISKTVQKSAVRRNRMRRLLHEAIQKEPIEKSSWDVALVALPGFVLKNREDAVGVIKKLFFKIR